MAINNVYNQTPKRIYTNKPFVKGMSYTNADLNEGVCRAVANLDMESSNTATTVRQAIHNKSVTKDSANNIAFKFYNKMIIFDSYISEAMYDADIFLPMPGDVNQLEDGVLGLSVKSESSDNLDVVYPTIIYNDTNLEFLSGNLSISNNRMMCAITDATHIYPLKLNSGIYPHCINSNDYSFSFLGVITNYDDIIYKGIIKIYYHVSAQRIILEVISPYVVDPYDVSNYGSNIIASNPLVYKDYVSYANGPDRYLEYAGGTEESKIIGITTVQVYDDVVPSLPYDSTITANIVKGISKNTDTTVYVRPYVALPKGDYYASLSTIINKFGEAKELHYDFNNNIFVSDVVEYSDKEYYGNKLEYTHTFTNINDQNGSFENINGFDELLTYSSAPIILDSDYVNINIPPLVFRSVFDRDYDFVNGNNEYIIALLNNCNYPNVLPNMFGMNNNLISYLDVSSMQQTASVMFNNISTDPNNPTKLPISFTAKEYAEVYLSRVDEPDDKIGILESNVDLGSINLFYVHYNDFELDSSANVTGVFEGDITISNLGGYKDLNLEFNDINDTNKYINLTYIFEYIDDYAVLHYTLDINNYSYSKLDSLLTMHIFGTKHTNILYSGNKTITNGVNMYFSLYRIDSKIYGKPILEVDLRYFNSGSFNTNMTRPSSFYTELNSINNGNSHSLTSSTKWSDLLDFANTFIGSEITYKLNIANIEHSLKSYGIILSSNYFKQINWSNDDIHDFSLPINTTAFSSNLFDNINSIIFTVTIFSGDIINDYIVYDTADKVSATSAPLQINLSSSSLLRYDEINNEYKLSSRPNNIAMHLGHYVLYDTASEDNSLFYSYYGNPSYFPSMYMITLDNPIVHVHPHQNNLVVFTTNDIYLIYNGNVPSTTSEDGTEVAFTVKLIQSNIRLGTQNCNTVRSIGKDVFFITSNNDGYLLKANKYVNEASDTYLIKITNAIDSLLNNPYEYTYNRLNNYKINNEPYSTRTLFIPNETALDIDLNSNSITKPNYTFYKPFVVRSQIRVIDGDTIDIQGTRYRLAGINTPECTTNIERLGLLAKLRLTDLIDKYVGDGNHISIVLPLDENGNIISTYGRRVAFIFIDQVLLNAELLIDGLAELSMDKYSDNLILNEMPNTSKSNVSLHKYLVYASEVARYFNIGVYNTLNYYENTYEYSNDYVYLSDEKVNSKFVYATNSYVYIVNSIVTNNSNNLTIIYKYNIDYKTWTSYDVTGSIFPVDYSSDSSKVGFKLYCSNSYMNKLNKASVMSFEDGFNDYTDIPESRYTPINVYFDSGNQSLAIMNDKLFREIKLFLGAAPDNLLDIDYCIKLYVDGKEVQPNEHYKGKYENDEGFKKITFFAPARGRIPRITFSIDCASDLNILQYAIVYLQLNAK